MVYVLITKNNDGGVRFALRDVLERTTPMMQSRRLKLPSEARREAQRLFGAKLEWKTGASLGLPDFVLDVAVIDVAAGVW